MKIKRSSILTGVLVTFVCFAVVIAIAAAVFRSLDSFSGEAETETVERAVRSAVMTCYAVEGAFPDDLEYLRRNYGLVWDADTYIVVYDAFASNIMPDMKVLVKGGNPE